MNKSVFDPKTLIARYTSQSWESIIANPLYDYVTRFRDVLPKAVPCELPEDKGTRYKIDPKPNSKNFFMKQRPLPRKQVVAIDNFFCRLLSIRPCKGVDLLI